MQRQALRGGGRARPGGCQSRNVPSCLNPDFFALALGTLLAPFPRGSSSRGRAPAPPIAWAGQAGWICAPSGCFFWPSTPGLPPGREAGARQARTPTPTPTASPRPLGLLYLLRVPRLSPSCPGLEGAAPPGRGSCLCMQRGLGIGRWVPRVAWPQDSPGAPGPSSRRPWHRAQPLGLRRHFANVSIFVSESVLKGNLNVR